MLVSQNITKIEHYNLLGFAAVFFCFFLLLPVRVSADVGSGYQEYYIPGATDQMWAIFDDANPNTAMDTTNGMYEVIGVTASLQTTTIYYDHWEDGYDFDPGNPSGTADESYTLNQGDVREFSSSNVPVPRGNSLNVCENNGSAPATEPCYDGRDRIYSAGGPISVTKAQWPLAAGVGSLMGIAWEILPTKPLLANYTLPVGVDLAAGPYNYTDFGKVYAIVQAVDDTTNVQIDDPASGGVEVNVTLNKGETTQLYNVSKGTTVTANKPVQAQIVDGVTGATYKADGITLIPDTLWSNSYYNPATSGDASLAGKQVDIYVYNPNNSAITVNFEDTSGSGSFVVNSKDTKSYSDGAGHLVPVDSGVYLSSINNFWAIGSGGTENSAHDWGFSLIPTNLLTDEYFLGWAPGSSQAAPTENDSPVYVTPVSDDTTVYVDYSPTDGIVDASYVLDRLQVQKIFDPDNVNTGMHFWATDKIASVWGENLTPATPAGNYGIDVGYTTLPILDDWIDAVLDISKTANPASLALAAGQSTYFTVTTTANYAVDNVDVFDSLPPGWVYDDDTSVITRPDGTTVSGNSADPSIIGQNLTWNLDQDMTAGQTLKIVFRATTTVSALSGYNQNNTSASGTRFSGGQTFSPIANAFVYLAPLTIDIDTTTPSINPGGVANYIITLTNYGLADQTNVTINDILPTGFTYVSHSISEVNSTRTGTTNPNIGDSNLTWGTWTIGSSGSVTISFTANVSSTVGVGTYDNTVSATTTQLGTIDDEGLVAADKDTPGSQDPEYDEDVALVLGTSTTIPGVPKVPNTGLEREGKFPLTFISGGLGIIIIGLVVKKYSRCEIPVK